MSNKKTTVEEFDWEEDEENGLDLRKLVSRIRINWYWSLLWCLIAGLLAFTYLYFAVPTYKTQSMILIKEDDSKSGSGGLFKGNMELLQGLGIVPGVNNVNNELEILKSYSLMNQVVQHLSLNLRFYTDGKRFTQKELYGSSLPFRVSQQIQDIARYNSLSDKTFKVTLGANDSVALEEEESKMKFTGTLDSVISLPGYKLLLEKNPLIKKWNKPLLLKFSNLDATTNGFSSRLTASLANKQASIVNLTFDDNIPERSQNILSYLVKFFIANSIADRNAVSDSTIAFINTRLVSATDDLNQVESNMQGFKQRNNIVDISTQAQALVNTASQMTQAEAQKEVQLSMVNSLINFMQQTSNNPKLVPATLTVDNSALNPIVEKYNMLLLERERNLMSLTEDNPIIKNIDQQLVGLRTNMMSGLQSMQQTAQSGLSSLRRTSGGLVSNISAVPGKEKAFLEISRQQSIKQELYLFLLQKKEEAGLAKSSNMPNARLIDEARTNPTPKSPKSILILSASLLIGLIVPLLWSGAKELLNNRISMKEDIEKRTNAPIIGEIAHARLKNEAPLIVTAQSRDAISEQFRLLRSNINYILTEANEKVIMVTSSLPEEGKTFISLNLAAALTLTGKKVAIMGMDLRKPKLSNLMGLKNQTGISNYLIGNCSIDDIIYPVAEHDNLYLIPTGPVPPNPSELIMLPAAQTMMEELRKKFDFIVVDTAPIIVTDSIILGKHADATIFITRPMLTYKDSIQNIDKLFRNNRLPKVNIVVNDINVKKSPYYGYGNYYYYGYYEDGKKKRNKD